jgi:hypothetical protein
MGKCLHCPLWTAIEGVNEISDGFDKTAVDSPTKPGAGLQKRHKMQRAIFQSIEHRIDCHYTTDGAETEESDETGPVSLDDDTPEETALDTQPVHVNSDQLLALLGGQAVSKPACMEPFQMAQQMMVLQNGDTVWPDGHLESPENRRQRPQSLPGDGQYL